MMWTQNLKLKHWLESKIRQNILQQSINHWEVILWIINITQYRKNKGNDPMGPHTNNDWRNGLFFAKIKI